MKNKQLSIFRSYLRTIAVLSMILTASMVQSTNHMISFGGGLGLIYSPDQLTVAVGDSITWQGSFSTHPLSSTSVPQGAATFNKTSGSTFIYHVLVAGTYNYICDIHVGAGMTGSFNATVTDITKEDTPLQPASFRLAQNYPNPFNAQTQIQFELPSAQHVKLKVYAITGAEVSTLIDGPLPAGRFSVFFDAGDLASGVYFYRLISDRFVDTKRLVLAK